MGSLSFVEAWISAMEYHFSIKHLTLESIQCCKACWVCTYVVVSGILLCFLDQIIRSMFWMVKLAQLCNLAMITYLFVVLLYDIVSYKIAIKFSDFFGVLLYEMAFTFYSPSAVHHQLTLEFFFGNTPFIWNKIPFTVLSLSNHYSFCDTVKGFLVSV